MAIGELSGERRQVTALFYDIVGSTNLLHRLDPEEFGAMQRALHQEAARIFRENCGRLESLHGDGGCGYFGFPEPLEDAAECGVSSALELIRRCARLQENFGYPLRVRIGVATGFVVVADNSSAELPAKNEIIGVTPALAARIQEEADPNSIAVADETFQLTRRGFDFEEIGLRHLQGFDAPIRLWRPLAHRKNVDRFTTHRRPDAPLIGRSDELDRCMLGWKGAQSERGQLIYLQGEAGIGKSRLVAELRRTLVGGGAQAFVFQCRPRGDTQPFHPFLEPITQALGVAPKDDFPDVNSVSQFLRTLGSDLDSASAEIVAFLISGKWEKNSEADWQVGLSDDEVRSLAVDAVLAMLTSTSQSKPVLIVIEDLHWADTLTTALVSRLPDWVNSRRVLCVVTSRKRISASMQAKSNVVSVGLSGLSGEGIAEIVDSIWTTPPPQDLSSFIYEKSDGIPLFAEELALFFRERLKSDVRLGRGAWELLLRDGNVASLQDIIAARLADLGPLKRFAQIASVAGRTFEQDIVEAAMHPQTLPMPFDDAVDKLLQAGIVVRRSGSSTALQFRHALIQDGAYNSLLKSERRELHTRIIELVKSGSLAPLADETMAWHLEQAGMPLDAARHAIQAAEACVIRSAMREADRLLELADRQLNLVDSGEEAEELQLRLLTTRGPVAAALFGRGGEKARSIYDKGVSICSKRSEGDRAAWFPLYWGWWFTAHDFETQRNRSDILLRDFENSSDPEVRLQSLHCAWATNIDAGLHSQCLQFVEEGLHLYDSDRARFSRGRFGGHDAKVCGLGERAFSLWFMGDDVGSAASIAAAKDWADHIGHLNSMLHALEFEIELKRYRNDTEGVIATANQIVDLAQLRPSVLAKANLFRAWAIGMVQDASAGIADFEAGRARQQEIATYEGIPVYDGMRAELHECAGRVEEAASLLDDAIATSMSSGQVFWLAEMLRHRARLRAILGQTKELIWADLKHGLEVAHEQQAWALASRLRTDIDRFGFGKSGPST